MRTITITKDRKLSQEDSALLAEFLSQEDPLTNKWNQGDVCTVSRPNGDESFILGNDITRRPRAKPGQPFDAKLDDLKSGAFGSVSRLKSLVLKDSTLIEKEKARVIKKLRFTEHYTRTHLEIEHEITVAAKHIKVKNYTLVETENGGEAYLVMAEMPGKELYDFLTEEIETKNPLSYQQRLQLTLAIAKAVKTQLVDNNIEHGDLKNSNVMVLKEGDNFIVNTIDFGNGYLFRKYSSWPEGLEPNIEGLARVLTDIWSQPAYLKASPAIVRLKIPKIIYNLKHKLGYSVEDAVENIEDLIKGCPTSTHKIAREEESCKTPSKRRKTVTCSPSTTGFYSGHVKPSPSSKPQQDQPVLAGNPHGLTFEMPARRTLSF